MPVLSPHEVRVLYRFTESLSPADVYGLSTLLSQAERDRANRFVFPEDRRDFVAAHALARRMLSAFGGRSPSEWRFEASAHGKPRVAVDQRPCPAFNLSHTRGLVACAVAYEVEVGVDVEAVDRATIDRGGREIVDRCFSRSELGWLETCPPHEYGTRFIECWTLKEAHVKALGTGLNQSLDCFSLTVDSNGAIQFVPPVGELPRFWQFAIAAPGPGFRLAVAVTAASPRPRCEIRIRDALTDDALTEED